MPAWPISLAALPSTLPMRHGSVSADEWLAAGRAAGPWGARLLALWATGAFDMVSVVIRQSLVQLETPNEMRGRVSAVTIVFLIRTVDFAKLLEALLAADLLLVALCVATVPMSMPERVVPMLVERFGRICLLSEAPTDLVVEP